MEKLNKTIWQELEANLKQFDYTYMFSDDHRTWLNGNMHEKAINQLISSLVVYDKTRVQGLIDTYKSQYGTQFEIGGKE